MVLYLVYNEYGYWYLIRSRYNSDTKIQSQGYMLENGGNCFDSRQNNKLFLFSKGSRSRLKPIRPHIPSEPGVSSQGVDWFVLEADNLTFLMQSLNTIGPTFHVPSWRAQGLAYI
jgi:hypothetical protein